MGEDDLDASLKGPDPTWTGPSLAMSLKKTTQLYGVPESLQVRELKVANIAVFGWDVAADGPVWPNDEPGVKLYNINVTDIQLASDHASHELDGRHTMPRSDTALITDDDNAATSTLAACCMMPEINHIVITAHRPGKNTGLRPVAEKFVNMHNPHNKIELGDDQVLLEATHNAIYVISTIPGHTADNTADVLAGAGIEPFSGLLLDIIYDPCPTKLMEAWHAHGGCATGGEEMLLYQTLIRILLMIGIWGDDLPSDADQCLQNTTTEDDRLEIAMRKTLEETLQ